MPIEKTCLNERKIALLLKNNFGLCVKKVDNIPLGTANCFKIITNTQIYFLKEYPTYFTRTRVNREAALNSFLTKNKFPTAKFIGNIVSYSGRYIALQEFIDAKTFNNNNLPDTYLMESAELLGRLHSLLSKYKLPVSMDKNWCDSFDITSSEKKYDTLLKTCEKVINPQTRTKIKEDLIFKRNLLKTIKPYGSLVSKSTYRSTHGDYNVLQYLCNRDGIKAVIDFSQAAALPAVWEIMRSYMQSATDTKNPFDFNLEKFCRYVKHYMKFSSLSKHDIKYMPYVYLYQLARSRFGYKEYLTAGTQNKEELIRFAYWRTEVCRMLFENADNISQALVSCF